MKTIPPEFTKGAWIHRQIARHGEFAIYQRSKIGGLPAHFEVVRIRTHGERLLEGRIIGAGEAYPSASHWGEDGWTYPTEEEARKKFNSLTIKKKVKKPVFTD